MKHFIGWALAVVVLSCSSGMAFAQDGVAGARSADVAPAARAAEPVAAQPDRPQRIVGEVTSVNREAGTVTVKGQDVEVTLPTKGKMPEVGQRVVITIRCRFEPFNCTITISW